MLLSDRLVGRQGTKRQFSRSQDIVQSTCGSDPCPRRNGLELGVSAKPGDPDHDSENDKRRAVGFHLLADRPLACIQRVAAGLLYLPLHLDGTGFGSAGPVAWKLGKIGTPRGSGEVALGRGYRRDP